MITEVLVVFLIFYLFCLFLKDFFAILKRNFLDLFEFLFPQEQYNDFGRLKNGVSIAGAVVMSIVILIFFVSIYLSGFSQEDVSKATGPLGDLFNGLLAPILTFLTFCGFLVTIVLQQIQMKLTLEDLRETRNETRAGNDALRKQKFDQNFFFLLEKQEKIAYDLHSDSGRLESVYVKSIYSGGDNPQEWDNEKDRFISFFLMNYQILDYIFSAKGVGTIEHEDARRYCNIVRAVTSNDLLCVLLKNCDGDSFVKYKKHLEEARFFEHFSFEGLSFKVFIKLLKTWNINCLGDFERIKKYMRENLLEFRNHISCLPSDVDESFEHAKSWANYYTLMDIEERKSHCIRYLHEQFERHFSPVHVLESQESFVAFIRRDSLYFVKKYGIHAEIIDDFSRHLAYLEYSENEM